MSNYFSFQLLLLRMTGQWPIYEYTISYAKQVVYNIYGLLVRLSFISFAILETIQVICLLTDLDLFTQRLPYCFQHDIGLIKLFIIILNKDDLRWLINITEEEPFQRPYKEKFLKEVNDVKLFANRFSGSYVGMAFLTLGMGIIAAGLMNKEILKEVVSHVDDHGNITIIVTQVLKVTRHLPNEIWYSSYVDQYASPIYEMLYMYEATNILLLGSIIVGVDVLLLHLIIHTTFHFRTLQRDILNVYEESVKSICGEDSVTTNNGKQYDEIVERKIAKDMIQRLKSLVKYHLKILEFAEKLEDTFSWIIFAQFLCTLLSVACVLYQMSEAPFGSPRFIHMVILGPTICFQLFMNCLFGNALMVESLGVYDAIYESNWEKLYHPEDYKQIRPYLLMMMCKSKRPTVLTAKKFSPITLNAFISVVKASYSYYTLLATTSETD